MSEEWRPVVGYEGVYEISSLGRLQSMPRVVDRIYRDGRIVPHRVKGHMMPVWSHPKTGHLYASLSRLRQPNKRIRIHRMVLEAFVGSCPDGREGCHRDGDPTNNAVANLYWGTRSENVRDMLRHGRGRKPGVKTHCPQGHAYTPENTYLKHGRYQTCRKCQTIRSMRRYEAQIANRVPTENQCAVGCRCYKHNRSDEHNARISAALRARAAAP